MVPVSFGNNGAATVDAVVTGSLSAPKITAQVSVNNFAVQGRPFTSFTATLEAAKSGASVKDALLTRGPLQARFSGAIGMHQWVPEKFDALHLDATVRNTDVRDVLALAGQADIAATGALTADAHLTGTVGDPRGDAVLRVDRGSIEGEPFDSLALHAVMTQSAIDLQTLQLIAGASRIDATGHYQHAPDRFAARFFGGSQRTSPATRSSWNNFSRW